MEPKDELLRCSLNESFDLDDITSNSSEFIELHNIDNGRKLYTYIETENTTNEYEASLIKDKLSNMFKLRDGLVYQPTAFCFALRDVLCSLVESQLPKTTSDMMVSETYVRHRKCIEDTLEKVMQLYQKFWFIRSLTSDDNRSV